VRIGLLPAVLLVSCCVVAHPARVSGASAVLPHRVPVGMYNVYSSEDGNLGSALPDLREVWEGAPTNFQGGYYPYEACNLVQHYWPPNISPDVASAVAWWSDYMRQAYEAAHEEGRPRLRVIVGELYSQYAAHGDEWLREFITRLSRWEQNGPWQGVLAGWYTAEGPFGASHNYDPSVFEAMVALIDETEAREGLPRRAKFVDLQTEGGHYTPDKFVRFARPCDVVLLSVTTYLWSTTGRTAVPEPAWRAIHRELYRARQLIYPDRAARGLSRPQIHVILELYNPLGGIQPTNWEMRQQIRTALTANVRDFPTRSAPADGVWFFWWPATQYGNAPRADEWNVGRRLAEAIEVGVAEATGASEATRLAEPLETRFRFSPKEPFNPLDASIPYELQSAGVVDVEVRSPNGTLVARFERGAQSSGRLDPFGGPRWTPASSTPDGDYIFRLYVDGHLRDEQRQSVQTRPILVSADPRVGEWASAPTVRVVWRPPPVRTGVSGYAAAWSSDPDTVPAALANLAGEVTDATSGSLLDGAHYLHIRARDDDGNWTPTAHFGPFYVDTTPPTRPTSLRSPTHRPGVWEERPQVEVLWDAATDASGRVAYAVLMDGIPQTEPTQHNVPVGQTQWLSPVLREGRAHYVHVRAADTAGNLSDTAHLGPFLLDFSPPPPVSRVESPSHPGDGWSAAAQVVLKVTPPRDGGSGTVAIRYLWDTQAGTIAEADVPAVPVPDDGGEVTVRSPVLPTGAHYVHLLAEDAAGKVSAARVYGPYRVDRTPPSTPARVEVTQTGQRVEEGTWAAPGPLAVRWSPAEDRESGVVGYRVRIGSVAGAVAQRTEVAEAGADLPPLPDGRWALRLAAVDAVGNESAEVVRTIQADGTPPTVRARSATHSGDAWSPSPDVTWQWQADDGLSGVAEVVWAWDTSPSTVPDGANRGTAAGAASVSASPDGVWYFHVRARDGAGNFSAPLHIPVRVDATAPTGPTFVGEGLALGAWNRADGRVLWHSTARSGVRSYVYVWDHAADTEPPPIPRAAEAGAPTAGLADGDWWLHVRALSNTGLWSDTAHVRVQMDRTPPAVLLDGPAYWTRETPQYRGRAEDETSGVDWGTLEYAADGGHWRPFARDAGNGSTWEDRDELPRIREGSTTVVVRVRDRAGHVGVSAPVVYRVDPRAPLLSARSPTHPSSGGVYAARAYRFEWSVQEDLSGLAGFAWQFAPSGASPDLTDLSLPPEARSLTGAAPTDGDWTFHLRARDVAGNWSEPFTHRLRVDTEAPHVRVAARRTVWDGHGVTFRATADTAPVFGSGRVEFLVTTSEATGAPALALVSEARETVLLPLSATADGWRATVAVDAELERRLGAEPAEVRVTATDAAGNPAERHDGVRKVRIRRLLDGGSPAVQTVLSPEGDVLEFPPGGLRVDTVPDVRRRTEKGRLVLQVSAADPDGAPARGRIVVRPFLLWIRYGDAPVASVSAWDGVRRNPLPYRQVGDYIRVELDAFGAFVVEEEAPSGGGTWAAPNPFSPWGARGLAQQTTFYTTPPLTPERVELFDILGRRVRTLEEGLRTWDGTDDAGRRLEGGVYVFQVIAGPVRRTGSVTLIR
jgi:hypothetical protein